MNDTRSRTEEKGGKSERESESQQWYRNSLLVAVGYLDLTNAFDFPANVFNQTPVPIYAVVLMALGGSITILATVFAVWDLWRSRCNVILLSQERKYLRETKATNGTLSSVQQAWWEVNDRELGWEYAERISMDISMAIAGIVTGTGCLMAIRGDIPAIFQASNILSGYLGNSFVALYAVMNIGWSIFMWRRAHRNDVAVLRDADNINPAILVRLREHARRHKLYAVVSGVSMFISGVGSEFSAQHWPGYVILIPSIIGSIFCNYFWRHYLGYDRLLYQHQGRPIQAETIVPRIQCVLQLKSDLKGDGACDSQVHLAEVELKIIDDAEQSIRSDLESVPADDSQAEKGNADSDAQRQAYKHGQRKVLKGLRIQAQGEERFLLELYGNYLYQLSLGSAAPADESDAERESSRTA